MPYKCCHLRCVFFFFCLLLLSTIELHSLFILDMQKETSGRKAVTLTVFVRMLFTDIIVVTKVVHRISTCQGIVQLFKIQMSVVKQYSVVMEHFIHLLQTFSQSEMVVD